MDERTDIWSFGVVLYEMIAGRRPFEGKNIREVIASTLSKEPSSLKEYAPDISDELQKIVIQLEQGDLPLEQSMTLHARPVLATMPGAVVPTASSDKLTPTRCAIGKQCL